MVALYDQILAQRLDMTSWLIHFTRNRPAAEGGLSAKDALLEILKTGILKPGWGIRRGRRTIYGPHPAVCFTEQPLWAFGQYLAARQNRAQISGYGVLIHKHDAFADWANPVIYGLRSVHELSEGDPGYDPNSRLLDPQCLPLPEQYRYVTFVPNREPEPFDWTHEREWRWCEERRIQRHGGLLLLGGRSFSVDRGGSEGRVHVLVENADDVRWLQDSLFDFLSPESVAQSQGYQKDWRGHLAEKVTAISIEQMRTEVAAGNSWAARLDDWPQDQRARLAPQV